MRSVVRMVREAPFVHFYLVCGHMITVDEDLKGTPPASIDHRACQEEANNARCWLITGRCDERHCRMVHADEILPLH